MAGYIGSKAVNLSTTGADIAGDADVSGALDVGGAFTSQGIDDNATSTAMTLDASGNVGIGVVPESWYTPLSTTALQLGGTTSLWALSNGSTDLRTTLDNNLYVSNGGVNAYLNTGPASRYQQTNGTHRFHTATSGTADATATVVERMRITSAGQTLIGRTATSGVSDGHRFDANGFTQHVRDGGSVLELSRETSDGDILVFKKGTTTVGSIGTSTGNLLWMASINGAGFRLVNDDLRPASQTGANRDNALDLGHWNVRWNDAFIVNGVTTGSDGNDKQDIRDLTEAEQRVAVACKGLLKAWRWKSAVEEKGDNARIHCGIIAQDLQAAFAAEGLDAGRYAMFMSNTWWETQTEVPAVEAVAEVLDEEGNVVTEAVEAVDAYTRTDTYDTQEEAPEGATERTRLGVRYNELLAFIIGAL